MKKTLLALLVLTVAAFTAKAQTNDNRPPRVAVGFNLGATVGPHSNEYPIASGFGIKFEFPIKSTPVSIMASGAYTFMPSDAAYHNDRYNYNDSYNGDVHVASFAPLELGVRVYMDGNLFVEGNAGASFNLNESHSNYTSKKVALVIAPNIGYAFRFKASKKYGLDLSLGYETRPEDSQPHDFSNYGSYNQIAVHAVFSIGY
ncbi:hypothetical protein [Mucilaginibacter ginsenosidivorax]|uniref:Porin family protein n=1 Tax=Mucilaginibacter ginsenosidivorax TaxID=862126 RepID=A0A5B8VYB8_9SPHI|nr:hypothetical protein [Mucilaginibacter ginsenosidivorax]QEC75635.1 hypothetical protein FSB76_06615 [Mucilaginibacter ginsenosidivorax]